MKSTDPRDTARRVLFLALFVFLGLGLRYWTANATPLHNDEVHYAWDALAAEESSSLAAIRDVNCRMTEERRTAHPAFAILLTRWFWYIPLDGLFDRTPAFLRGFNILLGGLLPVAAWAIGRAAWGERQAWAAAVLAAICPNLIWVSRTLYLDTIYTWTIAAMVLCGVMTAKRAGWLWPVLCGVAYGFAASTKISAPILGPALLVCLALAPAGYTWKHRVLRVAAGLAAALCVGLLLNSPGEYIDRIVNPTDPRYRHYWDEGSYGNLAFAYLESYYPTILWDGPLTLLLLSGVGAVRAFRRFSQADLAVWACLVSLWPLVFMHQLKLSGPHGYIPVFFLFCVAASRVAEVWPPKVLAWIAAVHVPLALSSIILRGTESLPTTSHYTHYPVRVPVYTPMSDLVHRRNPPAQVVIVHDFMPEMVWGTPLRSGELSEAMIALFPCEGMTPTMEMWDLADAVILPEEDSNLLVDGQPPPDFRLDTVMEGRFRLYRRIDGEPARRWQASELVPVEEADSGQAGTRAWVLPGNVRPVTGHLAIGGELLPRVAEPLADAPSFTGKLDRFRWGNGLLHLPAGMADDVVVEMAPPKLEDIFWGF